MQAKKKVLLSIDNKIILTAKDLGLNLSKISENALKEAILRLKGSDSKTEYPKGTYNGEKRCDWCGGWDLNPRRPEPEDLKSSPLS